MCIEWSILKNVIQVIFVISGFVFVVVYRIYDLFKRPRRILAELKKELVEV